MNFPLVNSRLRACNLYIAPLLLLTLSAFSKFVWADSQIQIDLENRVPAQSQDLGVPETDVVNINAATPAVLASRLKGIGPSKAAAIVQYREQHGAFETVDALVNVKGIGVKTLEKLRDRITAGPFQPPEAGESLLEREAAARAAVQSIVQRSLAIRRAAADSGRK